MKRIVIALFAVLITSALMAEDLAAASNTVEKKRSFGLRKKGRGHVQLQPMIAPVRKSTKSKRSINTSVTVILTIRDNGLVGKVCKKGPRIADALLRSWYKSAIPRDYLYERKRRSGKTKVDYRRTPQQRKLDSKYIRIVNKAIKMKDQVAGIIVVKGAISMGGGSISRLPFSSVNGCDELEEKSKKKKK